MGRSDISDRHIYRKKVSKDWILQNDLYFKLNTGNEKMSQKELCITLYRRVDVLLLQEIFV